MSGLDLNDPAGAMKRLLANHSFTLCSNRLTSFSLAIPFHVKQMHRDGHAVPRETYSARTHPDSRDSC
jgi:hypothetical protein